MGGRVRRVDARLPLALLRAIQQLDTPSEALPNENLSSFFPGRLGLSGVVGEKIRHLQRLARIRRRVAEEEVSALLELISRRADAGAVLEAAGRLLAVSHFHGPLGGLRGLARRMPARLRRRLALQTVRSAHQAFLAASDVAVEPGSLEIRANAPLTARASAYGAACRLYSSLTAGLLELSGLGQRLVSHPECQRRGDARCTWRVEPQEAARSAASERES
ncbi:MAG: hypothetical protein JSU87_14395 [Gemmatimonadota bacterium]|nr:MAG: hypothetical protein JSU87_14395 [Gemmatimonadota bacterium]